MKNKKIYTALSYLTIYELNSFKKFLSSPYHNQNEHLVTYLDLLGHVVREDGDLNTLVNEEVWKSIFENTPYDDVRFRKLNSDIYKLFENFLAQRELDKDPTLLNSLKIRAFKQKKISELYSSLIKQIENAKNITQTRASDYYLNLFNIEKGIFGLQSDSDRKSQSKDPVQSLNIEEISLNLDVFFIAEKLKHYCTILSWSRSYNIDKKIAGIEFILKLARLPLFSEYPSIKIYYTISRTIVDEDNFEHYYLLKRLIDEHIHLFAPDEAKEIVDAAISYCIVKMNKGNADFVKESFDMYKMAIDQELLIDDGVLSPVAYRNIAIIAMRAKELEWAENFINNYDLFVIEEYRTNAKLFSLSRLYFFNKNYSKAIDFLNEITLIDFFYNANVRSLLMFCYYETGEIYPLDSLFQSFNAWVSREKSLTKDKKSEYLKMIKYTKKLTNIADFEKDKLKKLLEEVQITPAIGSKSWLLDKIKERIDGNRK